MRIIHPLLTSILILGCGKATTVSEAARVNEPVTQDDGSSSAAEPIQSMEAGAAESDPRRMERVFASEARDDAWASGHEATLLSSLRAGAIQAMPETLVQGVECHTTICKVTFEFQTEKAKREFSLHSYADALRDKALLNRTTMSYATPSGLTGVIYQTRSGYGFPFPDGGPNRWLLGSEAGAP
jgi:hypothetical protein